MLRWIGHSGGWIAPTQVRGAGKGLEASTLVIELARRPDAPAVLLDCRQSSARRTALSVLSDPLRGIGVLHRRDDEARRHWLQSKPDSDAEPATLQISWSGGGGSWRMVLHRGTLADPGPALCSANGTGALGMGADEVRALFGARSDRPAVHRDVTWFGALDEDMNGYPEMLVGVGTPIETPSGPVSASRLKAGQRVLVRRPSGSIGTSELTQVSVLDQPASGSIAPIRLVSGYLPIAHDCIVSPAQRVMFEGDAVEYLFGTDAVLIPARNLVSSRLAQRILTDGTVPMMSLELAEPGLLLSGRLGLLAGAGKADTFPTPTLRAYEAAAFVQQWAANPRHPT